MKSRCDIAPISREAQVALFNLLGCCACLTHDFDGALRHFQAAHKLAPNDARLNQNLALIAAPNALGMGSELGSTEAWRDRWFHTGDRVVRQPDGYFRFVDRLKDSIRRRSENISSFEVEQVLLSHPAVANAAAYPVRSSLAEDEVMAAVILHPSRQLTESELIYALPCLSR